MACIALKDKCDAGECHEFDGNKPARDPLLDALSSGPQERASTWKDDAGVDFGHLLGHTLIIVEPGDHARHGSYLFSKNDA